MLFSDGDKHAVRRELANRAFVPTAIEHLRPQVQKAVDQLLDGLQDKPAFDFVAEFSNILSVQIICDMFAVPEPMRKDFVTWTHSMSKLLVVLPICNRRSQPLKIMSFYSTIASRSSSVNAGKA